MLEQFKDENGQLKKPILISLIGAGGLVVYLLWKNSSSSTTSTGQSTALTPDLTGLQTAIDSLGSGAGGGSGSGSSLDPPATTPPLPVPWPTNPINAPIATKSRTTSIGSSYSATPILSSVGGSSYKATPIAAPISSGSKTLSMDALTAIKEVPAVMGENGSAGGGGQGLLTVPTISSLAGTVYAGLTHDQMTTIKEAVAPKTVNQLSAIKEVVAPKASVKPVKTVNQLSAIKEVIAPKAAVTKPSGGVSQPINQVARSKPIPV